MSGVSQTEKNSDNQGLLLGAIDLAVLALETERSRTAAELHSGIAQDLTGLIFKLMEYESRNSNPATSAELSGILKLLNQTLDSVRRLSSRTSPSLLKQMDLKAAMGWLTNYAISHRHMNCSLECNGDFGHIDFKQKELLFRWTRWLIEKIDSRSAAIAIDATATSTSLKLNLECEPEANFASALFATTECLRRAGARAYSKSTPEHVEISIELAR